MRGGALPLLAWGALLIVLLTINAIWTGDAIQIGTFAFASAVILGSALAVILTRPRDAIRPGPPTATGEPQAVPSASFGAVLMSVGIGSVVYGLVYGQFLVYFGAGLAVVGLGVLAREWDAERRMRRQVAQRGPDERP